MRCLSIIVVIAMLGCSTAFAQVGGMSLPTPSVAATSPLGTPGSQQSAASVGATGIPLGSTELASPGISPMLTDPMGTMISGTACLAGESASSGISGGISGASTYDGGGLAIGGGTEPGTALPGSAAPCAAAGSASAMASAPSTSTGGDSRTGIPLGSVEIGNAGVSPLIAVPAPTVSSSPIGTFGAGLSILGTSAPLPASIPVLPAPGNSFATNQSIMPCGSIVTSNPATFC
jgi:hypothetical protein